MCASQLTYVNPVLLSWWERARSVRACLSACKHEYMNKGNVINQRLVFQYYTVFHKEEKKKIFGTIKKALRLHCLLNFVANRENSIT
jgi:hypothetical protein